MTRVSMTFAILLLVATLGLGTAWRQIEALAAGNGNSVGGALLAVSGFLLLAALIGLGRILYITTTRSRALLPEEGKEVGHV